MRRLSILIAGICINAAAAFAADGFAERVVIGFSADGAFFAFEEYGIGDGSGYPYSTIYVIETATDSWVAGTPIRIVFQSETGLVQSARDIAYAQARPILNQLGVENPGRHLVHNPVTELTDGHNVAFLLRAYGRLFGQPRTWQPFGWTLTIDEFALPSDCADFGFPFVGFDLRLTSPTAKVAQLQHDTFIPESRACPIGYGVSDVFAFDRPQDTVLVVLVNVFTNPFEGHSRRRFLAIAAEIAD